ncbi:MAG: nucleotidyltransferase domain-containing protein [Chitinophagales bacterium]|nr:nucleotidyltransferase domain-containing protein [Chitinophagales bacterium]
MNLKQLEANENLILLKAISGSQAYGTAIEGSDTDIKGVFLLPKDSFFSFHYTPQVSDNKNDVVYYELGRFTELLYKNNPNLLELLAIPPDCLLYSHPLMDHYQASVFLSKRCYQTFGGYAMAQIKKARGLNKKIANPVDKKRKTPLDFCYVLKEGSKSYPLREWLQAKGWQQEGCGLVNIPHFRDTYALFYDETGNLSFSGIIRKENSNDIALSSIPKGMERTCLISFNKNGYQSYCKDYRHYWDWVEKRNELRYESTRSHGKNYDSKNMMHTFRLLDMAKEIALEGTINVRRPNRDFLLSIRRGEFEYDQLLQWAQERMARIERLYDESKLPPEPDSNKIEEILVNVREQLYYS